MTRLDSSLYRLSARVRTIRLGARIPDRVPLSVETGNKHGPIVQVAARLITGKDRRYTVLRCHVPETLTEATMAKSLCTAKELDGVIRTERRNAGFHRPVVLVTER